MSAPRCRRASATARQFRRRSSAVPITATVANGPGNPKDFVGLFCPATGNQAPLIWRYLDGSTTLPATGLESGTVTIDLPGPGGLCNVRFMLNGGSTVLAASETFDLPSVPLEMNVLTPSMSPQAPIDLAVLNAPGNASDWVGLYTVGAGDASWHQWMYLNGSTHAPGSGFAAATLRFVAPSPPGTYESGCSSTTATRGPAPAHPSR